MYLLCVQVGLWLEVGACCPAERMEKAREEEVGRGCVPGCRFQKLAFCAGSCASVEALELRLRQDERARWRARLCAACKVEEVEVLKSPLWVVCWRMKVASRSWEGWGPCLEWGGGACPCCGRMRRMLLVLEERYHDRLG